MNVIVTGASGLLGRAVVEEFKRASWKVLGLAHTRVSGDLIFVDLRNTEGVAKIIKEYKPHAIIHCAAQRSPDRMENHPNLYHSLNVLAPAELAKLAAEVNAVYVFISSDYVFDGFSPPYNEGTMPNPLNQYGLSKMQAERLVIRAYSGSIILRVPVLYGGEEYVEEGAISSLINIIRSSRDEELICNYNTRYPTHTRDAAMIILELVQKKRQGVELGGIVFNWCGAEAFTKYEMAVTIAQAFNLPHDHLVPLNVPVLAGTPRPHHVLMTHQRLDNLGIGSHTSFIEGIREFERFF